MLGMATGLAEAGFTPFVYSISTFASMRPYEFIRNGPVLHSLPVRIVGIGEGVDYGHNGMTHYALEDVALMRAQPGLALIAPADPGQVGPALQAVQGLPGPAYIRLSKQSFTVPGLDGRFEIGRAQQVSEGDDLVIVAVGGMAATAVAVLGAPCRTRRLGRGCRRLVRQPTAGPRSESPHYPQCRSSMSVEAHYVNGGVGSLVAEVIAEHGLPCRLAPRRRSRRAARGMSGTREFMHRATRPEP